MTSSRFRSTVWWVLLAGGAAGLFLLFIFDQLRLFLSGIFIWIALIFIWAAFSKWFFGLRRHLRRHVGGSIDEMTFVSKEVATSRLADMIRSLEAAHQALSLPQQKQSRFGISTYQELKQLKLTDLLAERISWRTVELDESELVNVPENAVYFSHADQIPFVAWIGFEQKDSNEFEDTWTTGRSSQVQICCRTLDEANNVVQWLLQQSSSHSVYRGRMLHVATNSGNSNNQTIRMVNRPKADRDTIILPDGIVELLERLLLATQKHHSRLVALGHASKLGVLLHGPPGTGKTLVTKYLIESLPSHTVVVPTDMAVETLRECFRLARYLQPAILVLEDVDLLAPKRDSRPTLDGLQELMNQLDGLASDSQAIVIMSTNRPDVLEPALAARPGRVSQAVEFPLPSLDERLKLLRLYLSDSAGDQDDPWLKDWADRIDGQSPAFIRELSKRAILLSLDRQSDPSDATSVTQADVQEAAAELILGYESLSKT